MLFSTLPLCLLSLALASHGQPRTHTSSGFLGTCNRIAAAISGASEVFYPRAHVIVSPVIFQADGAQAAPQYLSDISHYSLSSSEVSACSVEPGSVEDVSEILKILGSTRTPFAVKGGGHSTNPGFSSTSGVQIAMSRFNQTKFNYKDGTVEVGPGLTWDQVYVALNSTGVNVVGGREPGVGVAGLTLGGGYSFKTSQYGLAIDNVAGYELVLPNGTITIVTLEDTDLWFGLRGGLNNFGIMTKFILKSYPQSDVWGGFHLYNEEQWDAIKEALVNFQKKKDTKAAIVLHLSYSLGQLGFLAFFFYDGPTPGGIFDDFLAIPSIHGTVSTTSFSDLILSRNALGVSNPFRSFYNAAPVTQYSPAVFDAFLNQTIFWGAYLAALDENVSVTSVLEPFDSYLFSHGRPSAYPPDRSHAIFPSLISIRWSNASLDDTMASVLRAISDTVHAVALADGQNVSHAAVYVNYALFDTPLKDIYGENVERLREIKAAIDPADVMGLAGGFKF